jgi:hypothetical protein
MFFFFAADDAAVGLDFFRSNKTQPCNNAKIRLRA